MILLIHNGLNTFVKKDIDILTKKHKVKTYYYQPAKSILQNIKQQTKLLIWLIKNIAKAKLVYIWFADYHSLLPAVLAKMFFKKSIMIEAGYDVTCIKQINYGSFCKPLRRLFTKTAVKLVNLNLPVSKSLEDELLQRVPKANTKVVNFSFDENYFKQILPKEERVLCVAAASSKNRFLIKGLNRLEKIATKMPDFTFAIAGADNKTLKWFKNKPKNLVLAGFLNQQQLLEEYSKAKVYVQFSMREGMPNSVCEAMLCKCIPIVWNAPGLPFVEGGCGFVVSNIDEAVIAIKEAFEMPQQNMDNARKSIVERFYLKKREEQLLDIIKKL